MLPNLGGWLLNLCFGGESMATGCPIDGLIKEGQIGVDEDVKSYYLRACAEQGVDNKRVPHTRLSGRVTP